MSFPMKSCLGAALIGVAAGQATACAQYDDVLASVEANDTHRATALYHEISVSTDCDDALREWLGDYLARDSFLGAMDEAAPVDERRAGLNRALGYEKHWRSYAALGRLDWDAHKYGSAAVNFQLAINELVEGDPKHDAEVTEISEIYELASAALALADSAVEMPRTRSGGYGGVFATSIRGFNVEEVDLPITFEFGTTAFDRKGAEYAALLADYIGDLKPDQLLLSGHTDPVGSEPFNLELSLARADALGAFLKSRGFSGAIQTEGHGETQVPAAPPGVTEGSDEHYRIARRVAFRTR